MLNWKMANKLFGHYTSQAGLMGILSTETIWATNIRFLNDEHEFQDALNLIEEIVKRSKMTPDHRDYDVYKAFIDRVNKKLKTLYDYITESIFTFSLSQETDLLSQWRGYCPQNNGYCVVFDIDRLFEQIQAALASVHLVECVYEKDRKEKKLKKLLNAYWGEYLALETDKQRLKTIDEFADEVMLLASHFKHPSFSEEKEKRIVVFSEHVPDGDHKFREGRFSIIPYIELPAPRELIKKIVIGPTSNKNLSKRAVEMFLEKAFGFPPSLFGDLDVEFSKTPYRSW